MEGGGGLGQRALEEERDLGRAWVGRPERKGCASEQMRSRSSGRAVAVGSLGLPPYLSAENPLSLPQTPYLPTFLPGSLVTSLDHSHLLSSHGCASNRKSNCFKANQTRA
eukprot:987138-Rhodomonas_salina.4